MVQKKFTWDPKLFEAGARGGGSARPSVRSAYSKGEYPPPPGTKEREVRAQQMVNRDTVKAVVVAGRDKWQEDRKKFKGKANRLVQKKKGRLVPQGRKK